MLNGVHKRGCVVGILAIVSSYGAVYAHLRDVATCTQAYDRTRVLQPVMPVCTRAPQVDRDFNAIFSTLLPNTSARLNPPEGGTFLDGLEVRVAFGGVWKESLTELSGGQRSLLALSLVLALCR